MIFNECNSQALKVAWFIEVVKSKVKEQEREMTEDYKNFYANAVNLLGSVFDITMVFRSQSPQIDDSGQPMLINGKPAMSIADELTVRMSPQHAKALAGLLVQQIVAYEKQYNISLPLPPELEKTWHENLKGK